MNPEPTVGVKWRCYGETRRIVGIVDGLVVSRLARDGCRVLPVTVEWWREYAIVIPDPPKIKAGYCAVWEDGDLCATVAESAQAWRYVDGYVGALGIVEIVPDDHGGARLVPVDRDGNRIGVTPT